ncbi:MAG TPA: glucose-6-phosphate isomerase [Gammaproteobacteria bacterium]|nr:glucose-6-phosphate isomerase [Gammaproteobacteria bacterium]
MNSVETTAAWRALESHHRRIAGLHLRQLFADDPKRFERFSLSSGDLFLDYSKNRITAETMPLLLALARERRVEEAAAAMFRGDKINVSEDRAALHTALRSRDRTPLTVDGVDIRAAVARELKRLCRWADEVIHGDRRGLQDTRIKDVVNLGIGGSHLGPLMAAGALRPYQRTGLSAHFVANADPADLAQTLEGLDPAATLFIVTSKTFITQETFANAERARQWLKQKLSGGNPARHFAAVTANASAALDFGVPAESVFEMWDWVGGRYSLWSAVGLPLMLTIGPEHFAGLLEGACLMDQHFRSAPLEKNMPVILGLLGIWYHNFFGAETHAVLPYEENLKHLPAYLQQLDMESNGKRVTRDGRPISVTTGPILWGGAGTNSQHAFMQLLHQGGRLIPLDFLLGKRGHYAPAKQQQMLIAHCLAQAEALMRGRTAEETGAEMRGAGVPEGRRRALAPHRVFPGNNPSNMLLYSKLTPRVLGQIIALYEHKVFVQAAVWGNNPFDQWGVELGKQLAGTILKELQGGPPSDHDASTQGLLARLRGKSDK